MKNQNLDNKYINFLYRAGLAWINIYLFFKLVSQASNFARIYTNFYGNILSHLLIIVFTTAFFLLFRNLALLAATIEREDTEYLKKIFRRIGVTSVLIVLAVLLVQILPELLLATSYQEQGS